MPFSVRALLTLLGGLTLGLECRRLENSVASLFCAEDATAQKEPVMANLSSCSPAVNPRRRHRVKVAYRVRHWPAYNAWLKQRGALTVWVGRRVVKRVMLRFGPLSRRAVTLRPLIGEEPLEAV